MAVVARSAQMAYDMVGVEVDGHSDEEDYRAEYEEGGGEPAGGVSGRAAVCGLGSKVEEPSPYHVGVEQIERHARKDYRQRHLAFPLDEHREDEGALEVVEQEEGGHHRHRRIILAPRVRAEDPEQKHGYEYRRLHQHPSEAVVDGRSPFLVVGDAISGSDALQGDEDDACQNEHSYHHRIIYV